MMNRKLYYAMFGRKQNTNNYEYYNIRANESYRSLTDIDDKQHYIVYLM